MWPGRGQLLRGGGNMSVKQFVAFGLIGTVVLAFFIAMVIAPTDYLAGQNWYGFDGVAMIIFAIWGGILLLRK